ncbi:hypothetical protein CsSME_00029062 [Camellia sinensis var. sinensis]
MDNIHIFGYVEDMLEETVILDLFSFFKTVHNEQDFNVLYVRGANANKKLKGK